jgi:hypothetical protein
MFCREGGFLSGFGQDENRLSVINIQEFHGNHVIQLVNNSFLQIKA